MHATQRVCLCVMPNLAPSAFLADLSSSNAHKLTTPNMKHTIQCYRKIIPYHHSATLSAQYFQHFELPECKTCHKTIPGTPQVPKTAVQDQGGQFNAQGVSPSVMDPHQPTQAGVRARAWPGAAHADRQMQLGVEGAAVLIWQSLVNNYRWW